MNLKDTIRPEDVCFLESTMKEFAILELADLIFQRGYLKDVEALTEGLFYREKLMSTGIGLGIGIPHVRLENVEKPIMVMGLQPKGITDYEAIDNEPVKILIMIIVEKQKHKDHIQLLSLIMRHLKEGATRDFLLGAKTPEEAYRFFIG